LFPSNLRNKPFYVINGGRDRLYPTVYTEPFTRHLIASGVEVDYHPQPEGEHNTRWWPEVKESFEAFVAGHPRDPHPAKLSWEMAPGTQRRAHWLVVDELGPAAGEARSLPDVNVVPGTEVPLYAESGGSMFGPRKSSASVDLLREGNTVRASTRGAASFTLLLSPDRFDFSQPVRVIANGRQVFNSRVERNLRTLLKWAARDNDRTMLYAAEVKIKLPR
jgi:hypothetical protein